MDRAIPDNELRRRRRKRMLGLAVVLIVAIAVAVWLRSCISPSVSRSRILTAVVERGDVDATVSASGMVVPQYEQIITSPLRSTVLEVIRNAGDSVQAGQSILRIDVESAEFTIKQLSDQLGFLRNQKEQLRLQLERQRIELAASRDIKKLEVDFAQAQYDRTTRLFKLGGATEEAQAQTRLQLDIARRQMEQVDESVSNQRASLEAEIAGLDMQIAMKENEVRDAQRDLQQACVCPQQPGIVTWVSTNIGSFVNPGDVLARVADLGSYKIESQISDIHATKLRLGGPVSVRLGDIRLSGIISVIHPSVDNGIIRFDVSLDQSSHQALRPNQRTDVFVQTRSKTGVLRVANGPFFNGRVDQKVYVIHDGVAYQRLVDIGVSNFDYVEIVGDVNPGEEMIISNMQRYSHADQVTITE